jgi:dTDP-4-amino-4,6-dideoxy-D-galactose acyltransferase
MKSFVKYLSWDSIFFDFPVFKIDYSEDIEIKKVFSLNSFPKVLYYVFSNSLPIGENVLDEYNGKLVDEKVVLRKGELQFKEKFINNIELYNETIPNDNLYQLAKISGRYSRYKIDKRLPEFTFERIYNLWIENSCKNENSIIYICKNETETIGFITLEISLTSGKVGLIAVDDSAQGKGIGYELMCKVENHLIELGLDNISVATQKDNKQALKFYKRLGYRIDTISKIYHFILNNKKNENSL